MFALLVTVSACGAAVENEVDTSESALGSGRVCSTNSDCSAGRYCRFVPGSCGAPGKCTVRPSRCTMIYQPVCGCDGLTYGSSCVAAGAGVSIDHNSLCGVGDFCGGIAAIPCPAGLECVLDGTYPDAGGTCQVPTISLP
jgi:hypothetical protein